MEELGKEIMDDGQQVAQQAASKARTHRDGVGVYSECEC